MSTASKLPAAEQLRSNLLPGEQIALQLPGSREKAFSQGPLPENRVLGSRSNLISPEIRPLFRAAFTPWPLPENLVRGEKIEGCFAITELPGFATLQELRIGENIKVYDSMDTKVHNSKAAVYAKVELSKRDNNILVFDEHSDKMVDDVLGSIDPEDSGYVFFASELNIDPVRNCMVPRHRLATGVETEELVNRNIQLKKLPRLLMLDPIRRWHNFSRGSVVAIERHDGSMYYRLVV